MTAERWHQIEALFQTAVELEPARRLTFLDEACSGDQALRSEVESLMETDNREWDFIEESALEAAAPLLADDQPQLAPGQSIAHYEIVRLIGRGGMGEVYLAKDQKLNRRIALKLLPADYTTDKDRLRRFQQEAQAASALNHPNILTIYELGEVDSQPFIATEFVEGETLRERMKRRVCNLSETVDIAIQATSALVAAHTAGIVHRDIKPENMMLRPDGYVKVLDFGLAKLTEQSGGRTQVTPSDRVDISSGLLMGTIKYMSPEQAQGLSVDQRSDIFSLGVVLYEIITGRTPFNGESSTELIKSILKDQPPALQKNCPGLPDDVQRIVDKALARTRKERYQTAEQLLMDLKDLRAQVNPKPAIPNSKRFRFDLKKLRRRTTEVGTTTRQRHPRNAHTAATSSTVEYFSGQVRRHKVGSVLAIGILTVASLGIIYPIKSIFKKQAKTPWAKVTPLTLNAAATDSPIAFSSDGKYLAYVQNGSGLKTLAVSSLATGHVLAVTPPQKGFFIDVKFSSDGEYLYYVWSENHPYEGNVYRVTLKGQAPPTKLIDDVGRSIALSPDGERLAFWRHVGYSTKASLCVSDADGRDERELVSHDSANLFGWLAWSPNGEIIACSQQTVTPVPRTQLIAVNVKNGKESLLSSQTWAGNTSAGQMAWLSDGAGLITTQKDELSEPSQLWLIDYPSGEAHRITGDLSDYRYLTLSTTGLATVKSQQFSEVWVADEADANRSKRQITKREPGHLEGVNWTSDGRIIFVSNANANDDIWIMNADGSNRKQLTDDPHSDFFPSLSPDNHYIVFSSDRTGSTNIWRMDINGKNPKQLTRGVVEYYPQVSADGNWVVYSSFTGNKMALWRVSIDGGVAEQLTYNFAANSPVLSPDGKLIACQVPFLKTAILPSTGGDVPVRTLSPPPNFAGQFTFNADGAGLIYLVRDQGVSNLWMRRLDNEELKQLTNFTSVEMHSFGRSRDGKLVYSQVTNASEIVLMSK